MKKSITITVFIALFLLSFLLRKDAFQEKIPKNSVNHIFLLTTLEIWESYGANNFFFAPVQTYQNKGDKNITYYKRLEDKRGNNYYVSFPPMAFLFPYTVMKVFNLSPKQSVLQIINFFLHCLAALFIYGISNLLFCKKWYALYLPSLIAMISYLFIPNILVMHTWNYYAEMHGQTALVIATFFALKVFINPLLAKNLFFLIAFSIALAFLLYSEWIGIFFGFSLSIVLIKKYKENKTYRKLLFTTVLVSALTVIFIILQYSIIHGFENLLNAWKIRLIERSGFFGESFSLDKISYTYKKSYSLLFNQIYKLSMFFGYLCIILLFLNVIYGRFSYLIRKLKENFLLFLIIVLPALIHFVVFFNANLLHYACMAKYGIFISIMLAVLTHALITAKLNHAFAYSFLIVGVAFSIAISVINFKKTCEKKFATNTQFLL